MTTTSGRRPAAVQRTPTTATSTGTAHAARSSRALLACGVVAGPVFVLTAGLQAAFRDGFDLTRHPLSLLGLGDLGWIQMADFVVCGALSVACAVGMRRALRRGRGRTWAPLLVAGYGAGLVLAGFCTADPSMGFPAGAPAGNPEHLSGHAILHGVGAMLAFSSLIAACFVLARRFTGEGRRRWAAYSVATGVTALALVGWPGQGGISLRLAAGAVLSFGWLSAVAVALAAGTAAGAGRAAPVR